jgi:MFS family permease
VALDRTPPPGDNVAVPLPGKLGLLRDADYRNFLTAFTVGQLGQRVATLAFPLVAVLALDADEFQVGLLFSLATIGFLLVGLPAGAWVDRIRRRPVMVATALGRAAVIVLIPVAWWADVLTIWQLYLVVVVNSLLAVFFEVAHQSYLPHLVGRENLIEANTTLEGVRSITSVAGPGLAGQLIQVLSAPVAMVANALTLVLSAGILARIGKREAPAQRTQGSRLWTEISRGVRFVLGHSLLRPIAVCSAIFNLCWSAYSAMLMVFLARELGISAGTIGLVFTFAGVGGVVGMLLVRRTVAWIGQGPALWVAPVFISPCLLLVLLAEPGWRIGLAFLAQMAATVGVVVYNVTQVSLRQAVTPDGLLGRMNATIRFLVWGAMPVGGLAGGVLGQWLGVRPALTVAAIGAGLAFLPIISSPVRAMRELPVSPDADVPPAAATAGGRPSP